MLRSVGVPARMAVGYTPGELLPRREVDDAPDVYRVLERNAHAWPEVYFPGYGWVSFEPTASEPLLVRPAPPPEEAPDAGQIPGQLPGNDFSDDLLPDQLPPQAAAAPPPQNALLAWLAGRWGWLAGLLAIALAAAVGWTLVRRQQAAFFRDSQLLARLFDLLGLWAGRLRIPWLASHTPAEHASTFGAALPEAEPMVTSLAELFAAQRYGRQQPAAERLSTLGRDWQTLQPRFWQRWLFGELPDLRGRRKKE
jgi:hypothetical protein